MQIQTICKLYYYDVSSIYDPMQCNVNSIPYFSLKPPLSLLSSETNMYMNIKI